MRSDHSPSRYTLFWMLVIFYLLPLIGLCAYSKWEPNDVNGWTALSLGILTACAGSLVLFWRMARLETAWNIGEKAIQEKSIPEIEEESSETISNEEFQLFSRNFEEAQQVNSDLKNEIQVLSEKNKQLLASFEEEQQTAKHAALEVENIKNSLSSQLEQQQTHIRELQNIIAEQKIYIEKRQQQIGLLETKVGDLTYEIKTLLQLAEAHSHSLYSEKEENDPNNNFASTANEEIITSQIKTVEDASLQLRKCLDIAQKITGSYRFNSHMNAFYDSSADSFTLDLRRLCDSLRSENNSTILLYSPKEEQVLFVNNQIKSLTGWSPEKFVQNFNDILIDNSTWKQGVSSLAMRSETPVKLSLKAKTGQDINVQAHLGMIPTGIFRNHAIAILYSSPE